MLKLEKRFNFRKNTFVQLEEGDDYYLYGVWNLKDEAIGTPSYYEIFKKKIAKEKKMPSGATYQEREKYPSDNDFGVWSWCSSSMERVNIIKNLKLGMTI